MDVYLYVYMCACVFIWIGVWVHVYVKMYVCMGMWLDVSGEGYVWAGRCVCGCVSGRGDGCVARYVRFVSLRMCPNIYKIINK